MFSPGTVGSGEAPDSLRAGATSLTHQAPLPASRGASPVLRLPHYIWLSRQTEGASNGDQFTVTMCTRPNLAAGGMLGPPLPPPPPTPAVTLRPWSSNNCCESIVDLLVQVSGVDVAFARAFATSCWDAVQLAVTATTALPHSGDRDTQAEQVSAVLALALGGSMVAPAALPDGTRAAIPYATGGRVDTLSLITRAKALVLRHATASPSSPESCLELVRAAADMRSSATVPIVPRMVLVLRTGGRGAAGVAGESGHYVALLNAEFLLGMEHANMPREVLQLVLRVDPQRQQASPLGAHPPAGTPVRDAATAELAALVSTVTHATVVFLPRVMTSADAATRTAGVREWSEWFAQPLSEAQCESWVVTALPPSFAWAAELLRGEGGGPKPRAVLQFLAGRAAEGWAARVGRLERELEAATQALAAAATTTGRFGSTVAAPPSVRAGVTEGVRGVSDAAATEVAAAAERRRDAAESERDDALVKAAVADSQLEQAAISVAALRQWLRGRAGGGGVAGVGGGGGRGRDAGAAPFWGVLQYMDHLFPE